MIKRIYLFFISKLSGSGLYKYAPFRRANKLILKLIKGQYVSIGGYKLRLDHRDSLNLSLFSNYEPLETQFFTTNIKPGATILDIGANIGYYSLLFSAVTGSSGKVISFEPDRELFPILTENISANGIVNILPVNMAVSNRVQRLRLFFSSDKGDQRIYDSGDGRPFYEVDSTFVDEFCSGQPIDWVKIDVQGAEGFVLEGMSRTVKENPMIKVVCEFWPYGIEKANFGLDRFFDLLDSYRFRIQELDELSNSVYNVSKAQLLAKYSVSSRKFSNLLLTLQEE